jgi:capsular polysaccharide biosynthesis protein
VRFTSLLEGRRREDLSVYEILYVLWSRKALVAGAVLVLLAAAMLFSLSREPVYTAEATVSIVPRQQDLSQGEREAFVDDVISVVVADDELLGEVVDELGWRGGVADFRDRLEPEAFVNQEGSGVIVRFSGTTPEGAAEAVNTYSNLFVERVGQLSERRIAGGTLAAEASIGSEAEAPTFRSSPQPLFYGLAAIGIGILIGGGAALLLEGRASSWRDARDAEVTLKAPVVGVIPDYSATDRESP